MDFVTNEKLHSKSNINKDTSLTWMNNFLIGFLSENKKTDLFALSGGGFTGRLVYSFVFV